MKILLKKVQRGTGRKAIPSQSGTWLYRSIHYAGLVRGGISLDTSGVRRPSATEQTEQSTAALAMVRMVDALTKRAMQP